MPWTAAGERAARPIKTPSHESENEKKKTMTSANSQAAGGPAGRKPVANPQTNMIPIASAPRRRSVSVWAIKTAARDIGSERKRSMRPF